MQPSASSSLFQALASLTEEAGRLSVQLAQAAKNLQETGEIPSERLLEETAAFRRRCLALCEQGQAVAQSFAIPSPPSAPAPISLHELKALVQGIAKAEEQRAFYDDIRHRALTVLDRVLGLRHREQPQFPPLVECQERAREMRQAVADAHWPNLHPATESLANGEDPFSDLLAWIEQQDTLEDDAWALLQDTVEQFFGKPLAIAVSRGKLFSAAPPPLVQPLEEDITSLVQELPQEADPVRENGGRQEAPTHLPELTIEESEALIAHAAEEETGENETIFAAAFSAEEEDKPPAPVHDPLPDTVPLGALYGFSLEDSAQHIATMIAQAQGNVQHPTSLRDLMWRLIFEDKVSLAFHLASYLDMRHPELEPRLPSWLLRTLILGRHIRHPKGETARFLETDFAHCSTELYLDGQSEWNQAVTFLLAASALQPALLAPQTHAPAVLHALRWEVNLPRFSTYCKSIADYGAQQHPLDPNLLKKGKEQAAWQAEIDVLKQAVELWWARASRLPLTFAPAAKVWQRWLEPKGVIATLLSPIRHHDSSKIAAVKRAIDLFSDEAQFKREVDHTDRELLGRRLGGDITGRSLEQLRLYTREALGFARRWVELQEVYAGQRQGSVQEQAERLRQTILTLQGAVQEELSLFKRRHPSPLLLSSVACCRRAIDNLQLLFDPEAPFPAEEPLPRPLLYADLLRIPTVSLNEQWEVEGSDWEALVNGVLELVANGAAKKAVA